ncbi:hypothetical protein C8R43DRAFT_978188 [Mycena crocata]|nr:hypothetical protein C8R43DRAFT_978188 [Mycena crocata]
MPEPVLPPELERHIFEVAASSHSKSIPSFLLVAQRVKTWITPLLYKVVAFHRPLDGHISFDPLRFASVVQSQNISKYVEHICWDGDIPSDFDSVLASCSAVHDLAITGGNPSHLSSISAMPLKRLAIHLINIFPKRPAGNFKHSLFAGVTHLYLIDDIAEASWEDWKDLALLPCLTHLAFLIDISFPIFQGALAACPKLQALVVLCSPDRIREPNWEGRVLLEPLAHDTRFVVMQYAAHDVDDWQIGARGGDDFWARADKFIAQRISGEIDTRQFVLKGCSQ